MADAFTRARADYDAARKTRFKRDRGNMVRSTGAAADYHYRTEQAYFGMIEEARELFRNHALIGQAVRRLVANILCGGFTLDVNTGDKSLDADLYARWYDWAESPDKCDIQGEQDFHGLEKLTLQQVIVDGDLITLPTIDGELQQIEGHRLRTPFRTSRNIVHGVELNNDDKPRRREAYWIAYEDVEAYYPVPKASEMTRYPARVDGVRQVFHHYLPDRTSQTRGVSAFTAPMETAGMGDDLAYAQLVKAQMAACAVLIRNYEAGAIPPAITAGGQDTSTETRPNGETRQLAGWSPAMEMFNIPGETLQWNSPNVPNQEFFQHMTLILSIIAVNLDLPVQVLMLDATNTNFSGWRGSIDQARQRWLEIQRWLIQSFHGPVYRWKVRQWAAADPILRRTIQEQEKARPRLGAINAFGHVWHPAGWPYIEPTQDATGDLIQIRNNLTSPRRLAARRGMDYEDLLAECIEDRIKLIDAAQDAADRLNKRNKSRDGWTPLSWRDIAQPPMPEGVQVSVNSASELGANPADAAAKGALALQ
ncbi:MAG: phage portal protein [Rhodospirillales bacterium]|nr:phage portal protein [Rhodospirillales bacterium]